MEIQEETMMGSNDLAYIAKGKRTKRQRPQSPIVLAMTTSSSSSGAGGSGGGGRNYQNSFSPTSSTGFTSSTEEEEDMANCLILLATGQRREENLKRIEETGTVVERFNSRRFTEAATSTGKAAGFYVYECKTCNRCFPSFQALGGHRASHKKPKNMAAEDQNKIKPLPLGLSSEDETTQILPIQMISASTNRNGINNNKSKVHECSICGSEFSSGQALGGHMRRHRTTSTTTAITTTAISNNHPVTVMSESEEPVKKSRNLLSLDLNLPAPSEDDRAEGKFSFGSKQCLVFSASALVDCHY